MGIVFPLVGPLALKLGGGSTSYIQHCFGAIMGASLLGNVCSPLSDTIILSVLATRSDLTALVRGSLFYCGVVGAVSLVVGDVAVGLGLYGAGPAVVLCSALMFGINLVAGRKPKPQ